MFQTNWASEALFAVSRAAVRELQRREPGHPARTSSNRDLGWALYTRRKRAHVRTYVHLPTYFPIRSFDQHGRVIAYARTCATSRIRSLAYKGKWRTPEKINATRSSRAVGRYEIHKESLHSFSRAITRDTHNAESPLSRPPGDAPGIPPSANGRFNLLMVVASGRVGPISLRISPTLTWIASRRSDRPRNPRTARLTLGSLHIGLASSRTNSVPLSRFHAR